MISLQLQNVRKIRGTGRQAVEVLSGITFQVSAGEFIIIEGPSGSGKTTLLAVSAGLLQADSGTVSLAGKPIHEMSASARRTHRARSTGFVYQRSNLLGGLTVRDNILLMASLAGIPQKTAVKETDQLLEIFGLDHLAKRYPSTLSGGEEQRIALIRALVHKPSVVFADEPTGNLDSTSGQIVTESLQTAARVQGSAVVITTHDPRLASFATRRIRMEDGQLYENT